MRPSARRRAAYVGLFLLYFGGLWTFWDTVLVYPLKIFVVLLHEVSHAVAAVATGGRVERIVLDPQQGGACYCPGGSAFLTLSAGYLGSMVWGGLLLELARLRRVRAGLVVGGVGTAVATLSLLYVRSLFGLLFGIAFGGALLLSGRYLAGGVNRRILEVLGLTSVLYALWDIKSDVLERPHLPSDAAMLSELTGIPTVAWGVLWIALALLGAAYFLHRGYRRAGAPSHTPYP